MAKEPFQDPDLHTPAHDAIMMWLEENACRLIHELLVADIQASLGCEVMPLECITEWEYKHMPTFRDSGSWNGATRVLGTYFIDMMIHSWVEKKYIGVYGNSIKLACEVKPVIRSIGELIRQLRNYESKYWRVAVVSPDDRFRAIIEKQGFIFIKAPQPEYGPQGGLF